MKTKKFLNSKIDISKKVFRPRPETEFWVGLALKCLKIKDCKLKIDVLDMFSGTGCIGISILKVCPEVARRVDFVDIWSDAIEQIKINLKLNKIPGKRYRVYRSNLFEKLKGRKYDFIFANPPYVALDRISEVQKEVLENDPLAALFAGKDGTVLIEKFFKQVKNSLKPSGKIFMEFDPLQRGKIKKITDKEGFKVVFKKDQFGKIRWFEVGSKD
jgi:release factor glutamine methyltransferase